MKILIIGSGGREHALAVSYAKNKKVKVVYVAPGNDFMPFTNKKIKTVPQILLGDYENLLVFAKKEKIDLVDVAQDDVIARGFVNRLKEEGINAFGPTREASEIEWSKDYARNFMKKYKLPIPEFRVFNSSQKAISYLKTQKEQPYFVKASGLALGKGAIRADTKYEAAKAVYSMKAFGQAGQTFLIEESLIGEEFSLFILCDGKNYKITKSSQDHKAVYDHDKGPNTGGIGCISPISSITQKLLKEIENKIIKPTLIGLQSEKRPYTGVLYLGGMITKKGLKIIEFNARWGDPEAEVILPSIKTDYLTIVQAILNQKLNKTKINFDQKVRISIAGCSRGYPNDYSRVKGKRIFGLEKAMKTPGVSIFSSGIKRVRNNWVVNGGRVFHLVAEGKTIIEARQKAYLAMSLIYIEGNNLHYRTDIGWREIERENK